MNFRWWLATVLIVLLATFIPLALAYFPIQAVLFAAMLAGCTGIGLGVVILSRDYGAG